VVATLDHATGYELRLAILYLAPIALATWTGGVRAGVAIVVLSSLFWLLSFASTHPYSGDFFFYWEGVAMVAVYLTFVLLLARLHVSLTLADERFSRVLEELHSAVCVTDEDSDRVLYANQSLVRLIAADPRTLGASELRQRLGLGDVAVADAHAAHGASGDSIDAGFVSREVRHPANGRWYQLRAGLIPWKSGRRVKLQMLTDISEQKRARALKQQHQDVLHHTARLASLAEIASSLAHEVNQPLMAIASYNDACLRMLDAPAFDRDEVVTALQRCREQALRAGRVISHVREFIRSRRPSPSRCDVNTLVLESLELLEARLEDSAVTTTLSLSAAPLITHADQTLLVQVIVNLLQNAIDAMEKSAPARRKLSLSTGRTADVAIIVSVCDAGPGIPEAIAERLFTPLLTTKSQGMGLGLSICRSVVEAHDGRIWHSANAHGGCTFHFTLPAQSE
jgi:C4-dicarboxylate-specific signal transduction histidine kinase